MGPCPTGPFINYANLQFDNNIFDLPCITNLKGKIAAYGVPAALGNNACIHLIGNFGKGSGDPVYRLSNQLPVALAGPGNPTAATLKASWYPNGTTSTDTTAGGGPQRHLLFGGERELFGRSADVSGNGY